MFCQSCHTTLRTVQIITFAILRRYISSWRRRFSQTSTTIEWKLQSNQRRNVFRSQVAGQTDGTRYQPFNCSSKISLLPPGQKLQRVLLEGYLASGHVGSRKILPCG